jgi:hypothetical protein
VDDMRERIDVGASDRTDRDEDEQVVPDEPNPHGLTLSEHNADFLLTIEAINTTTYLIDAVAETIEAVASVVGWALVG